MRVSILHLFLRFFYWTLELFRQCIFLLLSFSYYDHFTCGNIVQNLARQVLDLFLILLSTLRFIQYRGYYCLYDFILEFGTVRQCGMSPPPPPPIYD